MSVIHRTHARMTARVMLAVLAAALGACSSFDQGTRSLADAITLYKPEVVQGNFVSKEQVAALQPGMTRLQVRDILGTPLVTSLFHDDRWDYVFTLKRPGVELQTRKLAVFFQGDRFERAEGDEMPTESEFVATLGTGKAARKVRCPKACSGSAAKTGVDSGSGCRARRRSSRSGCGRSASACTAS